MNDPPKKILGHIFDQIFGQVLGQGFDQGSGEGKNHKHSVQYYPAEGKHKLPKPLNY